jgi:hypothetical protein
MDGLEAKWKKIDDEGVEIGPFGNTTRGILFWSENLFMDVWSSWRIAGIGISFSIQLISASTSTN